MNPSSKVYAYLAGASYKYPDRRDQLKIDGLNYVVYDATSNLLSGYQGTAYIESASKDIIIAHRGTEPNLSGGLQDALTDIGMVASGFNAQAGDARRFTQRILERAQMEAINPGRNITVTGHSLGGTLAQITAHEFGLEGETFNAYGAANLQHEIPKGGHQVINHVRATDMVSAASHHFGSVKIYATPEDIDGLHAAGYKSTASAAAPRNPVAAAKLGAHTIANFAPDSPASASDLHPENEARARAYAGPIQLWRGDINALRSNTLSRGWEVAHKAGTARNLLTSAGSAAMHGDFRKAGETLAFAGERAAENIRQQRETVLHTGKLAVTAATQAVQSIGAGESHMTNEPAGRGNPGSLIAKSAEFVAAAMAKEVPASLRASHAGSMAPNQADSPPVSLDHAAHPGHAMFQQCLAGVEQLNTKHGVAPSSRDAQFAGALAVAAAKQGLSSVEHVFLSDNAERAFAAQGQLKGGLDGINRLLAHVQTMDALKIPLAQSSAEWLQAFAERGVENLRPTRELTPGIHREPPAPKMRP